MSSFERVKAKLDNGEPLDARESAGVFTGFFRFSRGDSGLQREMTRLAVRTFPDSFVADNIEAAREIVRAAAHRFVTTPNHPPLGSEDVDDQIDTQAARFVLAARVRRPIEPDMDNLLHRMLGVDGWYVPYNPENNWPAEEQPLPYASNFIRHGLIGDTTGSPVFNMVFEAAKDEFWRTMDDDSSWRAEEYSELMCRLAGAHLAYNPDDARPLAEAVANRPGPVSGIAREVQIAA